MPEPLELQSPPTGKRRWGWWLLLLIGIPVGVGLIWLVATRHSLKSLIAETDRLDPGWRLEEIEAKRADYPPEQNAAVKILAIRTKIKPGNNELAEADRQLYNLDPPALLNVRQIEAVQKLTEANADAIAEARTLIDFPHGRHVIQWSPDFISTVLKCQENRAAAGILRYDVLNFVQRGDADSAIRSAHAIFHVGCSVGDEPMPASQLVRIACQSVSLGLLERVLAQGEPSEPLLAALQSRIETEEPAPLLLIAFRGERAGEFQLLTAMQDGIVPGSALATGGSPAFLDPTSLMIRIPGLLAQQTAAYIRVMNEMVEIAKLPHEEWSAKFAGMRQRVPNLPTLVQLLVPAMDKVAQAVQRSYGMQRCAIIALAAERFRKKNNRWPESLDELKKAGLLKSIPTDPFVGGPLKWKRTADGVLIYTAGPDLKDDGGALDRANPTKAGSDTGFELWDPAKRRQPAPPVKKDDGQ